MLKKWGCVCRLRRRGAAAAVTVISVGLLAGFAALAVDTGHLYCVRTELQRTADAAAMAAASRLADFTDGDPLVAARQAAAEIAGRNAVCGRGITLDSGRDIVFGRVDWNGGAQRFVFTPQESFANAVRVTTRKTQDSANGLVPLFFARIFGLRDKNMTATATALLRPRDIVFVLDLSASHNDDSSLRSYKHIDIANRAVWASLWDDATAAAQGRTRPVEGGLPAGPYLGNMSQWGNEVTGPGWNFASDPGLVRLAKGANWSLSGSFLNQTLTAKGFGSYVTSEIAAVNAQPSSYASGDDASKYFRRRVRVALGLDRWKSGKPGGQAGGNGDNYINANEIVSMVPYPSSSTNPVTCCKDVGGNWDGFIDYVASTSANMCQYNPSRQLYGDPGLQYRFGLKTFVDYLLEKRYGASSSPGLNGAPAQPMGAVADASNQMIGIVQSLQGDDLIGIAGYGTTGYGPSEKPLNLSWLTDDFSSLTHRINLLQAGMWSNTTNIAQGIDEGVEVLTNSPEGRSYAAKIMILLTDGLPNQTRANPTQYYSELCQTCPPRADAKQAARDAVAQGIRIYTVSVGANSDQALMEEIAAIGHGTHFHAEGTVANYQSRLQDIFANLGGRRPIALIE